jgi:poly-gamma-glutamate synthesis protein (capsule biosynthesis protein)
VASPKEGGQPSEAPSPPAASEERCGYWALRDGPPRRREPDPSGAPQGPLPPLYPEKSAFAETAKRAVAETPPSARKVTGVIGPHHLLAADLVAMPFAYAGGGDYRRVIILSPDHGRRGKTFISVPDRDFRTALGDLRLDREAAAAVLESPWADVSGMFVQEHGIQALLPFVAERFPKAAVLPVALRSVICRDAMEDLARILLPLSGEGTLLVESTDFSHYLTEAEADIKDQESRAAILAMDPAGLSALRQPGHLDSIPALYAQLHVQRALGAEPRILAIRNSCRYAPEADGCARIEKTTSYIVAAFELPGP